MNITENLTRRGFYYDNSENVSGGNTRRHYHDGYELYFLQKGICNYFVDNRYYSLNEGDIMLIPSNQIHQTNYKKELHSRRLINCDPDYIPDDVFRDIASINYIFRAPELVREIIEIFDLIESEYTTHDKYSEKMMKIHVHRLFYLIARHKKENIGAISKNKTVEKAIKYIKKNYMHDVSLAEVADKNAVSGEHLSRVFKKEIGMGFNEYLNALRLQKAEFMLRNEDGKSVSEVAFACGFNDSNYFSYRFKKAYGVPPISVKNKK